MLMGLVALVLALYGLFSHQLNAEAGKHLLTIVVVCIGIPMMILGWFATKRPKAAVQLKASHPAAPWMWRVDWAAGRVDNSVQRSIFFLWVAVMVFNLVCLLAVVMVLHGARYGTADAWLAVIFPVVGLSVLVFAIKTSRIWGRFGRAVFAVTLLPARPGGVIAGEIRVPARLQPEHAYHLRLSCLRRTTAQRGKNRVTTERVLWQDEKWFRTNLPQPEAGATRLPVFFQPPADLPESTVGNGDGVQWRLEASVKLSGPDFHSLFEVPVFKPVETPPMAATMDTTGAAPVVSVTPMVIAVATDPSLPHQLTLDEVRKEIHSRIQVADKPEGREFIFPAGRNPGFASVALVLWLIWSGAIVLMAVWHAPVLFPLVFTAVDLLMSIFMLDLWLRRSYVLVTPAQVKIRTSWLGFKKESVLAAGEVASLKTDIGATAGHTAYYDLKIRARNGREYLAAKFLSHKPEADWLIRQMAAVLKQAKSQPDAEERG